MGNVEGCVQMVLGCVPVGSEWRPRHMWPSYTLTGFCLRERVFIC